MRALLIALIMALVGWIGGGSWYWVCKVKGHCGEETEVVNSSISDESTIPDRERNPFIVSYQNKPLIRRAENFRFERSASNGEVPVEVKTALDSMTRYLLANPEIDVEVTGQFSEDEENPSDLSNLGLARADYLSQQLIRDGLDEGRIIKSYEILDQNQAFGEENFIVGGIKIRLLDRFADKRLASSGENQTDIDSTENSSSDDGQTEGGDDNSTDEVTRRVAEIETPVAKDLYFGFNSYNIAIDDELRNYISRTIQYLKQNEDKRLVLTGHTDNVGKPTDNLKLGQNRAETVKRFFEEFGLTGSQIQANSKGEEQPIADNDSETGKSKNRRVEIRIE